MDRLAFGPAKQIVRKQQKAQRRLGMEPELQRQLDTFHHALHTFTPGDIKNCWNNLRVETVGQLKGKSASNKQLRHTKSAVVPNNNTALQPIVPISNI